MVRRRYIIVSSGGSVLVGIALWIGSAKETSWSCMAISWSAPSSPISIAVFVAVFIEGRGSTDHICIGGGCCTFSNSDWSISCVACVEGCVENQPHTFAIDAARYASTAMSIDNNHIGNRVACLPVPNGRNCLRWGLYVIGGLTNHMMRVMTR